MPKHLCICCEREVVDVPKLFLNGEKAHVRVLKNSGIAVKLTNIAERVVHQTIVKLSLTLLRYTLHINHYSINNRINTATNTPTSSIINIFHLLLLGGYVMPRIFSEL